MSVLRLSKAINSSKQSGVIFTFSKPCKFKLFLQVVIITLRKFTVFCDEFDSEFDGNDFLYKYSLDSSNADKFIKMLPHIYDELMADIEEWLIENIQCDGIGSDLKQKWIQMGLHGKRVVSEDYPGGIYREEAF